MLSVRETKFGLSPLALRLLGIIATIASGLGELLGSDYSWLKSFEWFAFPIFAFLLAQGVEHTTSKKMYVRRFLLFTVITEPLYDLYMTGTYWDTQYQSPMLTLFIGLLILMLLKMLKDRLKNVVLDIIAIAALGYGGYYLAEFLNLKFGGFGIIYILTFYVAINVRYSWIIEVAVMIYMNFYIISDSVTSVMVFGTQYQISEQMYAFASLIPIWLYGGSRSNFKLWFKALLYALFPIILIALYFANRFIL